LLKELLARQFVRAETFAKSLISLPLPTTGEARAKIIIIAWILILYSEDCGWAIVWNLIQQDHAFGRSVLESVSYAVKFEGSIERRLREDRLADLYVFLVQEYPDSDRKLEASEEANLSGVEAYLVKPEDSIRTWRDNILQRLQGRATSEACAALRKIIHELPEQKEQIQQILLETENLVRRRTWKPPTPEELLQLVLVREPSNAELFSQGETINQGIQKMADEPKVDNSIHIGEKAKVGGDVNTGNNFKINRTDSNFEKGFDWKFWLGLAVAIVGIIASVAASGVFNDEIKKWFIKPEPSPKVEQKLDKQTN
jgi:hypothetical protein